VHRWLLATVRTITPMPLMTGHAAIAAGGSQRLPDTCAAAPVTGDLAWRTLGAIPPLLHCEPDLIFTYNLLGIISVSRF